MQKKRSKLGDLMVFEVNRGTKREEDGSRAFIVAMSV